MSLLDTDANDIVVSMSDVTADGLKRTSLLDTSTVTLDQLYRGQQRALASLANQPENSAIRLHQQKIRKWRKTNDVPLVETTLDVEAGMAQVVVNVSGSVQMR